MAAMRLRPGLFPLEIALFAAVFWGDEAGYVPLSKTPFLFLIAWASLRLRGLRWRDVGLCLPERWPRLVAIGVAAGIGMWLLEFFFTMPMLHRVLGYWPDLSEFNDLVGNATLLAVYLALNWLLAAFGEEMVWRGYALPRVAGFFGTGMRAWILALVIVNVSLRPRAPLPGAIRRDPGYRRGRAARHSLHRDRSQPRRADRRPRPRQLDRLHRDVFGALPGDRQLAGSAALTLPACSCRVRTRSRRRPQARASRSRRR